MTEDWVLVGMAGAALGLLARVSVVSFTQAVGYPYWAARKPWSCWVCLGGWGAILAGVGHAVVLGQWWGPQPTGIVASMALSMVLIQVHRALYRIATPDIGGASAGLDPLLQEEDEEPETLNGTSRI